MFGRTKAEPDHCEKTKAENTKACDTCGCVVLAVKLKRVKYRGYKDYIYYYCGRCAPAYDSMYYDMNGEPHYFRKIPEHSIEVTEAGEEIKPKKGK